MYAEGDKKRKDSVLAWIKKKDLFSKKYVFVPIVMGYVCTYFFKNIIFKLWGCVVIVLHLLGPTGVS